MKNVDSPALQISGGLVVDEWIIMARPKHPVSWSAD